MLAGTGLYTVYARRGPAGAAGAASAARAAGSTDERWSGEAALREELIRHMAATLPHYMMPSAIVFLEAMPLTSSGKLDRRVLPAPRFSAAEEDQPPQGPIEEVVASVWRHALQVERVGRTTSFFELGGHSLLVTQVVAALAKLLRVQLPIRAMFDAPTVAGVAAALVAREATPGQTARVAALVLKLQSHSARTGAGGSSALPMGTHA